MILQRLPSWLAPILLGLFAYLPILSEPGVVNTGDSAFLLMRLHQLVLNLRSGVFPARWMPDAAYGLGYPFFNFYACFPYYIAGLFNLLGFDTVWSLKLTQILGFAAATVFAYLLAKNLWNSKAVALLTALAYTYTPFHLIQVYVRGDALSEFYAFAFYPLILLALWRLRQKPSPINIAFLALAYAGLILSHNISALVFSPFVGLWLIAYGLSSSNNKGTAISYLLYAISGIALGLALSAWFWLPALWEGKWVHLERMTSGYLNYSGHFRSADLVQWKTVFDYRREASPYAMGAVQAIFGLAGVVSIIIRWARRRRLERNSAFLLLMLAIVTFLITPVSRPIWDTVPLLPFVQFPWRFLAVQALPLSLVIGHLARWSSKRVWRGIIAGALGLALLATAMLDLPVEYLIIDEANSEQVALYEYFTAYVGSTSRNEYQPHWVEPSTFTSAVLLSDGQKPSPLAVQGELSKAKLLAQRPTEERWLVEIASPQASLAFHTYYFPGWQGYVDGQPAETSPVEGLGYIGLTAPQGSHQVILRLERTPVRAFGEGLSLAAVLAIIGLLIAGKKLTRQRGNEATRQQHPLLINSLTHNRRVWAIVLIVLLSLLPCILSKPAQEGTVSDLTLGFKRVPYPHHNPQGIPFENGVRLRGYQLSAEEVEVGETIDVTLYWSQISKSPEAVVRLVLPAAHLFQVPYVIAEDEAPLEATTTHHLEVPVESVRGVYFVSVGLRDVEGQIAALSEGGEPLDILCLSPVRLEGKGAREQGSRGAGGQRGIALVKAKAEQESSDVLRADLVWQASEQIPANYGTSIRLKDAEGYILTSFDAQPLYGFYPTSLWQPGERVYDRRWLPLPEGTPPGSDYSLEAIVYDVRTLQPLVTVQVENVALTRPTVKTPPPTLGGEGGGVRHRFPQGLAIAEVQLERTHLGQGEVLPLTVKWTAVAPVERDYTCLLKLKDERGEVAQEWQEPIASSYPTSRWPVNVLVLARYRLGLSRDLPAGRYHLVLAPSDALTGEELGEFVMGIIEVTAPERQFTVPEMETELGVTFGGEVLLLGYDLAREGEELRLELYWQALRQMAMDYKVFVHLFDPSTETIVAQHDAMPREGHYPTSRWAKGEVVSDSITLDLAEVPPGHYRLAVGIYDPQTVDRLPAIDAAGLPVRDNRVVLTEEIEIQNSWVLRGFGVENGHPCRLRSAEVTSTRANSEIMRTLSGSSKISSTLSEPTST